MKIGTRSILFGYHQFIIHPLLLFVAWWKLYGFPADPRLWIAFVVHDLGYWGKPNMDGPEGETHPETGAAIMHRLFDRDERQEVKVVPYDKAEPFLAAGWTIAREEDTNLAIGFVWLERLERSTRWKKFMLYHSRFYSRKAGVTPSRLCAADKLAIVICPIWLQLLLMNLTGEVHEYMNDAAPGRTTGAGKSQRQWVNEMKGVCRDWVNEYELGRQMQGIPYEKV